MSAACPTFGFRVRIASRTDDPAMRRAVIDDLRAFATREGLVARPSLSSAEVVVTRDGSQATDADRGAVARWGEGWVHAAEIEVGDLVDLSDA